MMARWIAEWDEESDWWQPRLIAEGVAPSLDIWFPTEADCAEWIKKEVG